MAAFDNQPLLTRLHIRSYLIHKPYVELHKTKPLFLKNPFHLCKYFHTDFFLIRRLRYLSEHFK